MRFLWAVILVLLTCLSCYGDFPCAGDGSLRQGSVYSACGVGTAPTEGDARRIALNDAWREFQGFCQASYDCRGREISVEPARTECQAAGTGVTCRRLVLVKLLKPALDYLESQVEVGGKTDCGSLVFIYPIGLLVRAFGKFPNNGCWPW